MKLMSRGATREAFETVLKLRRARPETNVAASQRAFRGGRRDDLPESTAVEGTMVLPRSAEEKRRCDDRKPRGEAVGEPRDEKSLAAARASAKAQER